MAAAYRKGVRIFVIAFLLKDENALKARRFRQDYFFDCESEAQATEVLTFMKPLVYPNGTRKKEMKMCNFGV